MIEVNPREFRVSDAEREHVVELLQKAIGRGLIDLDEFTTRTDTALAATTRQELNVVLIDLSGIVHRDSAPPQPAAPIGPSTVPLGDGTERQVLTAKYSSLRRGGQWTAPRELIIRNKYGATKLDFSEARLTSNVVHVVLESKWSSTEIVVPTSATVSTDSIGEIKYGSVDNKTDASGRAGNPHIVVTGNVHGGALKIRYRKRGLFSS
ncbi:uncharacterized protein DUF1707 [Tamaricihabitans halophyticus]|uniref:Uncharacterized protein DUF1707 n=1 Tax=Tamaricihabitans halophyticus TaxID=1262583 RepID=A0A4R2R6E5_9PSEU|nr:DUF1707 domain-containing protein [Tamaricihabitans halophyticus]TCP57408.1 uncharacterized protein DUF1707 [Tamaricihabitans halophyticus]